MDGVEGKSMDSAERQSEGHEGDDHARTGTVWTATAHIITAVIGAGVLALPWSVAQLGWVIGPLVLLAFSWVTYYTAILLCDCYRYPDKDTGRRNSNYMEAVSAILGRKHKLLCGVAQQANLWGAMIGYTITTATSMMAVKKSNCLHKHGHNANCRYQGNSYMIIFGLVEVILAQLPNLEKVTVLSVIAAIMSFAYSLIGLALCIAKVAGNGKIKGTLTGVEVGSNGVTAATKTWDAFQALGNIAFAYTFAPLLVEIQDTLRPPPPENQSMKKATLYGIGVTAVFYVTLGCIGYAAFGNSSPGNFLTGFGFYEPYWVIDIGNICIVIHLIGAYQVFGQPVFALLEKWVASTWPRSSISSKLYKFNLPGTKTWVQFTLARLIIRTSFVMLMTVVAMILPFFNAIMGLLGAVIFWPLTVKFPVSMYIAREKIKRGTFRWYRLQILSMVTFVVSLLAAVGSVAGLVDSLKHAAPFKSYY